MGSSFDREHFARTVVGLVEGPGCCLDPVLVTAVLDCLEYTLTNPVVYGPGNVAWPEKRCTTYHEDTVAADAVAAIFERTRGRRGDVPRHGLSGRRGPRRARRDFSPSSGPWANLLCE